MLSSTYGNISNLDSSRQIRDAAMSHFSKNQGESKFEIAIKNNDFSEIKKLLYLEIPDGYGYHPEGYEHHNLALFEAFREKTITLELLEDLLFSLLANDQTILVKHLIKNIPWVYVDQSQVSISTHDSLLIALLRKSIFEIKSWYNVFRLDLNKIALRHSRNQLIEIIQILRENQQTEFLELLLLQQDFKKVDKECFNSSYPLQQLPVQAESKVVVADKPKIDLAQLEETYWNRGEQDGDRLLESLTPRTLKGLLKNSIVCRKPQAPPAYEERLEHVASLSLIK